MSARVGSCPGCGAPIQFAWSSAVQTSCPYCKAIVVRHDVDLEKVGEVADLPPDASPIQLLTEGTFDNRRFQVLGRIRYEWAQGDWNEWHIVFTDSRQPENGWLSDAQADYAVSFLVSPPPQVPLEEQVHRGLAITLDGVPYLVTHVTPAKYVGFAGELPFRTTDRSENVFVDLQSQDGRFATIDYSEDPPLVYVGRRPDFDELKFSNLREFEGWQP